MIHTFLLVLFTLAATILQIHENKYELPDLRQRYLEASKDEKLSKEFYKLMQSYDERHPVVLAYRGAAEATMAKHVWNPYSKLKHLNSALAIFNQAVALDNKNAEIRFLRFTVEYYIPRYLKLSEHLEEDKNMVINALKKHPASGLPEDLAQTIYDFMLTKNHLTEQEKARLRQVKIN